MAFNKHLLNFVFVTMCFNATVNGQQYDPAMNQWVEYEVRGRLTQAGLPAASPATLVAPLPRTVEWQALKSKFDTVNWPAAVRHGVRNAVVRGGNELEAISDEQIRAAVAAAVIASINEMATGGNETQRFQRLIEQGVEDAMLEFFNELGRRQNRTRTGDSPASNATFQAPLPPDSLARHLPANHAEFFPQRYRRLERVVGGWFQNSNDQWIPLPLRHAVIARHREDQTVCDIWSDGKLIAGRVAYLPKKTIHTKEISR